MFSTKRLIAIACALTLVTGAAQAQHTKPAAQHTQPVSVRVPAADIDMGSSATAGVAGVGGAIARSPSAASQPVAQQPVSAPATPHLSIDDIDQITRSKIARQLAGEGGSQPGAVALNAPAPASAANPVPAVKVVAPRQLAEAVRFVSAFSDMSGPSVLYEFRSATYPAHVGTKLLNGWAVKRVEDFVVTVSDGKRTWTETISGGAANTADNARPFGVPTRTLNDLGGPLPSSIPLSSMGQ